MRVKTKNKFLPSLSKLAGSIASYETLQASFNRVDGLIIGTGESDFTQGNVPYTLSYQDKTFELIDVPGIEGDESRFISLVREAVAKAHLVFYVNGTNKKPEKGTAEKIRTYLRRGSHVCPLVNVRGNADSYEFDEDRESLHKNGSDSILNQTEKVLESVLGKKTLLPGGCVQGLVGFSSLAFDQDLNRTTIHKDREADLVRQQSNYLKLFGNANAMYNFSQMGIVAEVLKNKLSTFKEDIVESNKAKVSELLSDNLRKLGETLASHKAFLEGVEPEFDKCRSVIKEAVVSFERLAVSGRRNIYNELFNALSEYSDDVVSDNFGEAGVIKRKVESEFERLAKKVQSDLETDLTRNLEALQERLAEGVMRLLEDVDRVDLQTQLHDKELVSWAFESSEALGWNIGRGDFGSMVFQIGGYATTGIRIGRPFAPPWGAVIGGAVGAALGIAMAVLNLFMSKAKRIRRSQAEVRKGIDKARERKLEEAGNEISSLMELVRKEVREGVVKKVDDLEQSLALPLGVIDNQIVILNRLKNEIEGMPYGSTETV